MDNQKIVVTLLLITIILSVLSVVVTLSMNVGPINLGKTKVVMLPGPDVSGNGNIALTVQRAGSGGSTR